ncbi:hypothetical protein BJV82DRAFT_625814 [Fennellomyces sp. T-0311]|nr:hypothetical protein BJV82DRAFT_625814 [Fennellomyces sp. T-0311]
MSDRDTEPEDEVRPLLSWRPRPNVGKQTAGLLLILFACAAHASMFGFIKWSSATFASLEIVVASSLVQATLGLLGCVLKRTNPFGQPGIRRRITFRGLLNTLVMVTLYYALSCMPLGEVTAIIYIYPMTTVVLAALFFNEPFGWFETASSLLCILGIVLITKPYYLFGERSSMYHFGAFCAMLSAILAASADITVRNIPIDFMTLTFFSGLISSAITLPALFAFEEFVVPDGFSSMILLLIGVLVFIQQYMVEQGLRLAPAGPAALICLDDIIFSFVIGFAIFREHPDTLSIAGASIIAVMISAMGMKKWRSSERSITHHESQA